MTTKEFYKLVVSGLSVEQVKEIQRRQANPSRLDLNAWDICLLRRYGVRVDAGDVLPPSARRRARTVA